MSPVPAALAATAPDPARVARARVVCTAYPPLLWACLAVAEEAGGTLPSAPSQVLAAELREGGRHVWIDLLISGEQSLTPPLPSLAYDDRAVSALLGNLLFLHDLQFLSRR